MYLFRLWIQKKYTYLAECKELTKGDHFPEIAVFVISNKMSNLKHGLIVSVHYESFRSD
jgi:hypothetical protein